MTEQYLPKQDTRPTQIIYALYLAGLVTANVTLLIGVIIAYVYRKEAAPWLQAHYRFWIGSLYFIVTFTLSLIFIGTLLWPLLVVWLGVRCIIGWVAVRKGQPPARPGSWLW